MLIVDDVMSAGTAVRESIAIIRAAGATPHAVAIALDRQEKATENGVDVAHSAVQYVREPAGPAGIARSPRWTTCYSICQAAPDDELGAHHDRVLAYRARYGAG